MNILLRIIWVLRLLTIMGIGASLYGAFNPLGESIDGRFMLVAITHSASAIALHLAIRSLESGSAFHDE